jgi:hypothetical protein
MHEFQWIDATQTAALVTTACLVAWAFTLLRREIQSGMQTLLELLRSQREMEKRIERLWVRIDQLEQPEKAGHSDVVRDWVGKAWQNIVKIEARLDAIEKGEKPPPGTRPTDPPL